MNSHNRPMPYRKQRRRRQTVRTVLIVLLCVFLALILAFMVIGNLLLKKLEADEPADGEREEETPSDETPSLSAARAIGGYPILAETSDTTTFATRLDRLRSAGASAVSLPLNTAENELLYRSPVAIELGLQVSSDRTVTLEQVVGIAEQSGVYVSGTFYVTAFSEENDLLRSVALSHATAVLTEALRAGVDDVLLLAPDLTSDRMDELIRFAEGIRALQPDAVLGFALTESVLGGEDSSAVLAEISEKLNYLALDATQTGETDAVDAVAAVDALIHDTNYHYHLLYYRMRLLLPAAADETERDALIATAENSGFSNWQILGS